MFQSDGKSEAFSVFSFSCVMTVLTCSNYLMVRWSFFGGKALFLIWSPGLTKQTVSNSSPWFHVCSLHSARFIFLLLSLDWKVVEVWNPLTPKSLTVGGRGGAESGYQPTKEPLWWWWWGGGGWGTRETEEDFTLGRLTGNFELLVLLCMLALPFQGLCGIKCLKWCLCWQNKLFTFLRMTRLCHDPVLSGSVHTPVTNQRFQRHALIRPQGGALSSRFDLLCVRWMTTSF